MITDRQSLYNHLHVCIFEEPTLKTSQNRRLARMFNHHRLYLSDGGHKICLYECAATAPNDISTVWGTCFQNHCLGQILSG